MIDTKQCGWHVAEKEIVNGFKRPYIQVDEPDLAILRIKWNGYTINLSCDEDYGLYEGYKGEPTVSVYYSKDDSVNKRKSSSKQVNFLGDGVVVYDYKVTHPEPASDRYTVVDKWESKELRGKKAENKN